MATSAIAPIRAALMAVLNVSALTAAPPTGVGCPVYDFIAQEGRAYPYAVLQSPTENRLDTFSRAGHSTTFQVHIFASTDDVEGSGQAEAILAKVFELTNYAPLNLSGSGFDLIFCRPEDAADLGDEDYDGVVVKHYLQTVRVEVMGA